MQGKHSKDRKKKDRKKVDQRHGAAWGNRNLALVLLLFVASMAFAQAANRVAGKLSRDLAREVGGNSESSLHVIVQFKNRPTENQFAAAQRLGGRLDARLPLVNASVFTVSPAALAALAEDPNVAHISSDNQIMAMDDYTDAAIGMSTVRALGLGGGTTGIGVAVIDSGINGTAVDLKNGKKAVVVYHEDFTGASENNSKGKLVYDTYGHGTHVAGIIAGNGGASGNKWQGINHGVSLVDLRVLNGNGVGTDSQVIAAINRAIALKSKYNIRIINMSLGRPVTESYTTDPVCQAVEQAWKAGIVVVVAAGNYGRVSVQGSDGYGTVTVPGIDPFAITVGAMKTEQTYPVSDDQIASYSSKGPTTYDFVVKPDLVAPGNLVTSLAVQYSTLFNAYPANRMKGTGKTYEYYVLSGTSMATPVVSGAAAVLIQQNSKLTPDQIKARLMKTTSKTFPTYSVATDPVTGQTYTSYYDLFTVGAGYLNLAAAAQNSDLAPSNAGAALSPSVTYNQSNNSVTLVYGNSTVPPASVVWGGNSTVWGTSVVWGATNVSGSSVVWGASSVPWDDPSMSGFSVVWATAHDGEGDDNGGCSVVWGSEGIPQIQQAATIPARGER